MHVCWKEVRVKKRWNNYTPPPINRRCDPYICIELLSVSLASTPVENGNPLQGPNPGGPQTTPAQRVRSTSPIGAASLSRELHVPTVERGALVYSPPEAVESAHDSPSRHVAVIEGVLQ
ncbi:hypothetical protein CRG98_033986 [Punica granatum]|uniref:Uncharacterized protein n=1 Tax=Punica granatum TaxID=22663 RepID=A0A2I0IPR8_PUNGR|nr:hypothetical protein CRG98_033986 [Punica granatum]